VTEITKYDAGVAVAIESGFVGPLQQVLDSTV
jgi:hypothetical protein